MSPSCALPDCRSGIFSVKQTVITMSQAQSIEAPIPVSLLEHENRGAALWNEGCGRRERLYEIGPADVHPHCRRLLHVTRRQAQRPRVDNETDREPVDVGDGAKPGKRRLRCSAAGD